MRNIFHRSAEFVTEKIQRHKHHHHLFLAVLALAVAGTGAYTYRHEIAQAATYTFTQVSWIGGADTGATASHTSNQTGWDKYYSASTSITAGADVRLLSAGYSFVDDGTTGGDSPDASGGGFSSGTPSQAVVNGSGGSASVALAFVPAEYDVETGGSHTCAAKSDGTAYCWGYNNYGQLGNNTTTNISTPVQVLGVGGSGFLTGVSAISAGASHTCALKSDETVFCWGQNNVSGQLGDNTTTTSLTPVQVLGVGGSGFLTGVSAISAGASHTCAVKSDGTAYCWGEAANYQLGHYSFTDSYTPAQVHGVSNVGFLTGVSAISAGDNQTCAVKTDGTAYCWGLGTFGRLGDNTTTQRSTPVQVHGVSNVGFLAGVAKITTDAAFSCAAKSDGTAYCWGYNGYGQLGDNTTTQRNTPVQVHGVSDVGFLTDVSMIFSAGDTTTPSQTCALKTDGTAYCWGYNGFGQLGDNTTTQRNTPVQVHGVSDVGFLTGVGKIVTGYSYVVSEAGYTCAAKSDGTAYCWGNNGWGRLGDNTATHRSTPVQVHGVSDVGFLSLFTPTYYSSGTFTSATIDFARPTIFTTMSWTATLNGQTITMKARSSATSDFSGATAWGSCSNVTSGGNMSDGGCVTNGHQYLQYQATLSGDTVSTPTLDSVTINDTQYSANGGTLTSSKYDAGDDTNLISRLSWVGSATSSTEVIKFQVRSASSAAGLDTAVWCGPSITCDGTDYFLYTDNGVALATNHPLRSGANDRWVQYKVYLTSAGAITPLLTTVAVQYVVNAPPAVGNIQASQITDSGSADYGKVSFTFDASDSDTASGTVPYLVTPTLYEYYNGTSWTTISSGLSANAYSGITLTGNSATTTTAVTWTPTAGIALTSNAKVRVTISDGEAANATAIGTMAGTFTLDTTVPDITSAVIDSSVGASTAVGNTVGTITFSITDSSDKQYRFCNNSAFTSPDDQGNSCGWSTLAGTISGVATSTWVFTGNSADEAVYMQARDLYGNTTATRTIVAPAMPASFQFTDASNVSTGVYREFLSWSPFVATTSSTFGSYKVYYSLDNFATAGTILTTITNSSTNYYVHNVTTATSSTQYYRVLAVNTEGSTSNYTAVQSDVPDGSGGLDTTAPYIPLASIASPTVGNTSANITFSTYTDSSLSIGELATSTVFYDSYSGSVPSTCPSSRVDTDTYTVNHSIYLTGLSPDTTYYYCVTAKDMTGNPSTATTATGGIFATIGGPVITNVTEREITNNSALIFWNTSTSSTSYVRYATTQGGVGTGTLDGNAIMVPVSDTPGIYQHQVGLTGLTTAQTYYFQVTSTDSAGNGTTDTNNGQYYSFVTLRDTSPPLITGTSTPVLAPDAAVIVWQTDEPATTRVDASTATEATYNKLGYYKSTDSLSIYHIATLSSATDNTYTSISAKNTLATSTPYVYRVTSIDAAGNPATTDGTFETPSSGSVVISVSVRAGDTKDTTPPSVSSVTVSDITPFSAVVKFSTDEDTDGFVKYGKDVTYGDVAGDDAWAKTHTIKLRGLTLGTEYHIKVASNDKAGNTGTSADQTFKTTFLSENLKDMANVENIEQFQKEIENAIESILPSLVPPFVTKPTIVDITESGAKVTFKSNIKAFPVVVFAEDGAFDETKENPYVGEVSDTTEKATSHELVLTGLKGNTKYHVQARAFSLPKVLGKSADVTFITKASKIAGSIVERKKDSFTVVWTTEEPTSSIVEFKDLKRGIAGRKTDDAKKKSHSMKIENLPSGTAYEVNLSGVTEQGNIAEAGSPLSVTTSTDTTPPTISGFKVDNALVPGRTDRIQTIVSWVTDEPSTSTAYYEEGAGTPGDTEELANKNEVLDSYVLNHSVILPSLKPGTIYRLKVTSTDDSGNEGSFGPRTVITPKQTESITDIIFKNFEDSFKFLQKI